MTMVVYESAAPPWSPRPTQDRQGGYGFTEFVDPNNRSVIKVAWSLQVPLMKLIICYLAVARKNRRRPAFLPQRCGSGHCKAEHINAPIIFTAIRSVFQYWLPDLGYLGRFTALISLCTFIIMWDEKPSQVFEWRDSYDRVISNAVDSSIESMTFSQTRSYFLDP